MVSDGCTSSKGSVRSIGAWGMHVHLEFLAVLVLLT